MTTALNYCRQYLQFASKYGWIEPERVDPYYADLVESVPKMFKETEKITLPKGGMLFYDPDLKALDTTIPLRLPYPAIVLEHEGQNWKHPDKPANFNKTIILAKEMTTADGVVDSIVVMNILHATDKNKWYVVPPLILPSTGYLQTQDDGTLKILAQSDPRYNGTSSLVSPSIAILLQFLNVLSCSNVGMEKTKQDKPNAKLKSALPFDDYWVLQLNPISNSKNAKGLQSTHHSPREHLRRGHIRRLQSGVKVWVNAHIVAAGTLGKITKDYKL